MLRQRHVALHQASNGPSDQVLQSSEEPAACKALHTRVKSTLPSLLLIIGTFAVTVRVCCGLLLHCNHSPFGYGFCTVLCCTGRLHSERTC